MSDVLPDVNFWIKKKKNEESLLTPHAMLMETGAQGFEHSLFISTVSLTMYQARNVI